MSSKKEKTEKPPYYATVKIKKPNRVPTPPARLPVEIVERANDVMERNNWTVTEFIERAWTLLVELEELTPQEKKRRENEQA